MPKFRTLMPALGWTLRLCALAALIWLDLRAGTNIWQMAQNHDGLLVPVSIGIGTRILGYNCNLMALWTAGSILIWVNRETNFVFSGLKRMGLWFLAGAAPVLLALAAIAYGFLTHGKAAVPQGEDFTELAFFTVSFALIGLMLLVAAKQGKSLSGQLEQFV